MPVMWQRDLKLGGSEGPVVVPESPNARTGISNTAKIMPECTNARNWQRCLKTKRLLRSLSSPIEFSAAL